MTIAGTEPPLLPGHMATMMMVSVDVTDGSVPPLVSGHYWWYSSSPAPGNSGHQIIVIVETISGHHSKFYCSLIILTTIFHKIEKTRPNSTHSNQIKNTNSYLKGLQKEWVASCCRQLAVILCLISIVDNDFNSWFLYNNYCWFECLETINICIQ